MYFSAITDKWSGHLPELVAYKGASLVGKGYIFVMYGFCIIFVSAHFLTLGSTECHRLSSH